MKSKTSSVEIVHFLNVLLNAVFNWKVCYVFVKYDSWKLLEKPINQSNQENEYIFQ